MLEEARAILFDGLPKDEILGAYLAGRGKEVESGKFTNPESSSALVANVFGPFLTHPGRLQLPQIGEITSLSLECELRFPWRGGLHPWLDVVVETNRQLIGIESKRYEPFRDKKALFSESFKRDVWGLQMEPYLRLRNNLSQGYLHLDPVQLTKHALALRTQACKRQLEPVLIYLYAEPQAFPKGTPIQTSAIERHRHEVQRYSDAVAGAEVKFLSMMYGDLLGFWKSHPELRQHAERIEQHYALTRNPILETDSR